MIYQFIKGVFVAAISLAVSGCADLELKPEFVIARSADDIKTSEGKWVKPVVYHVEMDFSSFPVDLKKKKFIDMMLPSVLLVKHNMEVDRERVGDLLWRLEENKAISPDDSLFLYSNIKLFKAKDPKDLHRRMATHPTSIVLAQAAIESGWGSSRFFNEANNIFGIWSYNSDESRIEASESRGGESIYLRKYPDISGSINDYFVTVARAKAYEQFRKQRIKMEDPYKLTYFLKNYSELRYGYVSMLNMMIRENDLTQYDSLKIDPSYYNINEKILLL